MFAASSTAVRYEPIRSMAFGLITAAYQPVGTPLENPVRILKIKNATDVILFISFDGVNDHEIEFASKGDVNDYGANRSPNSDLLELSAGTTIYVRAANAGALPVSGSIYITAIYAGK